MIDDEEFFALCVENRKLRIERASNGEIIVMPPAGGETSYRNSGLIAQLVGKEPERLINVDYVDGESPVDGFRLKLTNIWAGL